VIESTIMLSWIWPLKSVKGDVVVITGGAMGIGRRVALQFADLGVTFSRNHDENLDFRNKDSQSGASNRIRQRGI